MRYAFFRALRPAVHTTIRLRLTCGLSNGYLKNMKFILFDIDCTLIDSGGAGTKSLDLAFEEMFSISDAFKNINMAGKTDLGIIREGINLHGIEYSDEVIPGFCETYIKHLRHYINNDRGHIKAGVMEALETLRQDEGLTLGLLTGNIAEGAGIKLEHFGLNSYFKIGAFGDDDENRNNLLPIAVDKFHKQHSHRISYSDCVVIGDTPMDIRCSKPYGALSIAVATGPYSFDALSDAGADVVLGTLEDTKRFVSFLIR